MELPSYWVTAHSSMDERAPDSVYPEAYRVYEPALKGKRVLAEVEVTEGRPRLAEASQLFRGL
jgi:hypothetical protein